MSASIFVYADQEQGGRWEFTGEQVAEIAAQVRPGSTMTGPFDRMNAYEIGVPGENGAMLEVLYQPKHMSFSFEVDDFIDITGGLVYQILNRLAPGAPAKWLADFVGEEHPVRLTGKTESDFVQELLNL